MIFSKAKSRLKLSVLRVKFLAQTFEQRKIKYAKTDTKLKIERKPPIDDLEFFWPLKEKVIGCPKISSDLRVIPLWSTYF